MKFCGQCAGILQLVCRHCEFANPADFKFCGNCGHNLLAETNLGGTRGLTSATRTTEQGAERRQITVLFCDVVGSSQLSEELDPEELRDIMQRYRVLCNTVIENNTGFTAQYLGDGILAYFGYPTANEDDARHAVSAGLEIIVRMCQLNQELAENFPVQLALRIGIHTGLVVIGDLRTNAGSNLALGTTPNIAARLQDLARANQIVLSAETYKLIRPYFKCQALGEHALKGFSRPITVYLAQGALDIHRWLAVSTQETALPLIGRDQESALLLDRVDQAIAGVGQAVLLSGEAGIGKSRLAQFVREHVAGIPHTLIECWGTPQFQHSYLHCVINVVRRMWQLDELTDKAAKLARVEKALATLSLPVEQSLPLIADLIGIALDMETEFQRWPLQERKERTLELLLNLFTAMAMQKVVIFIAEDLHWIDPTTVDLLGRLIDQVPTLRVFVLLTFRMEFVTPWLPRSHLTHISINRLTRKQSGQMIRLLAKNKTMPMELLEQIIDKTDGIPFFLEEMTRMILDSGMLQEYADHYRLRKSLSDICIPSTLQDSLMAKLDKLGPGKQLAQICAIVGREFQHDLLQVVVQTEERDFCSQMSRLVLSELLYQRGLPPHASYMFRHALVHEAAYESLLKKTRLKYHQQIARILIEKFPELRLENPELVAYHYAAGGDHEQAIKYWIIAGETALRHCAVIDAIIHLSKGLDCFHLLPPTRKNPQYELTLQAKLGIAYIMSRGYGSAEVESCFSRAYTISRELPNNLETFPILCGLWEYYVARAELPSAFDLAGLMEQAAANLEAPKLQLEASRAKGSTLFWQGKLEQAKPYLERGTALLTQAPNSFSNVIPIQDPAVAALSNYACLLWLQGNSNQARNLAEQAVATAEQTAHPFSAAYAHLFCAVIHQLLGNVAGVIEQTNLVLGIANRYNFLFWQAMAKMLQAWAQQRQTSVCATAAFEGALALYHSTGSRITLSYFQALLAELQIDCKQYHAALRILDTAMESASQREERFYLAELMRLKACCLYQLVPAEHQEADRCLLEALNLARQQGAKTLELRIFLTLRDNQALRDNQNIAINPVVDNVRIGELQSIMDEDQEHPKFSVAVRLTAVNEDNTRLSSEGIK